ncbi:aspartate/glutamate racemase family protein [Enterovirga sp.]|uniref:aspartate/glutamate racemase family protein n=1 Tax=Enterovirga sp. TaxID=2026350 RepID=UPI002D103253|nr:aspartate/glutamate racemase family protein [Enterovirga sp.]HMO30337.1 aspartate/glutamate racemase family protein [Enterovirga sp.]
MTLRIWHQSVNELSRIGAYKRGIEAQAAAFLGPDAEVHVQGLPEGTYGDLSPSDALGNAYTYHRVLAPLVEMAVEAETRGYDAFVMGSFSEPFLREMRTAVDIPVVSLTEASLLVGCSLGSRIGLISNAPNVAYMTSLSVAKHHLEARVLEVTSLSPGMDEYELMAAREEPSRLVAAFAGKARELIARGADVIVPAEGVMAEILAGEGIRRIDKAVVLDVFMAAWAHALSLVRLRRGGIGTSRAWLYSRG